MKAYKRTVIRWRDMASGSEPFPPEVNKLTIKHTYVPAGKNIRAYPTCSLCGGRTDGFYLVTVKDTTTGEVFVRREVYCDFCWCNEYPRDGFGCIRGCTTELQLFTQYEGNANPQCRHCGAGTYRD